MNLNEVVDRAQRVLAAPREVWPAIKEDGEAPFEVYRTYLVFLAIIPAVARFIGESMVGYVVPFESKILYVPIGLGLLTMLLRYALILAGVYLAATLIAGIAPRFKSQHSVNAALKLVVYSGTAGWLASGLYVIPRLGDLSVFGYLYSAYLLYIGLPVMLETPEEKAPTFAVLSLAIILVLMIVASLIINAVLQ